MAGCFDLPAELRNRIYFLVIPHDLYYDLGAKEQDEFFVRGSPQWVEGVPAICQASKQLRNETLPIWRATNNFEIEQNAYRIPNPPTIHQILRPHLQGGVQHTRHFDWDILGAERLTPGRDRLVPLNMRLELHDDHCKLSAEFRHCTFHDDRCLSSGSRSTIQRRVLRMFAITEELLGRRLTWEGALHCKQCKREFEMEH